MSRVALINGPNLNLLGTREPEIYGTDTLEQIVSKLEAHAKACGYELNAMQSNVEGELVDAIQAAIEAIGEGEVDNPICAAKGYRRFRPVSSQRLQSRSFPARENHRHDLIHQSLEDLVDIEGRTEEPSCPQQQR